MSLKIWLQRKTQMAIMRSFLVKTAKSRVSRRNETKHSNSWKNSCFLIKFYPDRIFVQIGEVKQAHKHRKIENQPPMIGSSRRIRGQLNQLVNLNATALEDSDFYRLIMQRKCKVHYLRPNEFAYIWNLIILTSIKLKSCYSITRDVVEEQNFLI